MLAFLIMAGGSGERFFPLSTKKKPKQLLKVFSDKSLIRLAYERVLPLVDKDQIFIATNEIQLEALKADLTEVNDDRIIIEPAFKNTASAISYGSLMISKYYDNPTIVVLASDHLIQDEVEFRRIIKIAEAEANRGFIVTLGIAPTYPETGYGYIEVDGIKLGNPTKALAFKEKPNLDTAKVYLDSKRYLWNSGMFIFNNDTLDSELKLHSPNHYQVKYELDKIIKTNEGVKTANLVKDTFLKFENNSIDYALMEKSDKIMVIPSSFGWNDVGGFLAFDELFEKDDNGNVTKNTNVISVDSNNNIIVSDEEHQRVNLLGIHDMIVAVTKDEILICDKKDNQRIKEIVKIVNSK